MSDEARKRTVDAYRGIRERVSAVALALPDAELALEARACPGWSVQDVLAHMVGVATDVTSGGADAAGSPGWTAGHVTARTDRSVVELVEEWNASAEGMDAAMASGAGRQILSDALTHEQDFRGPLGPDRAFRPDDAEIASALGFVGKGFAWVVANHFKLPAFEARTGAGTFLFGEGDPAAVLETDSLDLMRSLMGRRTIDQIASLRWSSDPATWYPAFTWAVFVPPTEPTEPVLDPA